MLRVLLLGTLLLSLATPLRAAEDPRRPIDYLRDIKPILTGHCSKCHGALRQQAELRLDTGKFIRQGGESGEIVAAGNSEDSRLIEVIIADGEEHPEMPPEGQGTPLEEKQIALLKAWIDQGAKIPNNEPIPQDPRKHWSFQQIKRPAIPQIDGKPSTGNPIDAFIQAQHKKHGLKPQPAARKELLLRRLHLDLVGLPPTREQLHAFLTNTSTDAYEKVVDELLASPRYGERWGRHWMDVWRYSDWAGYRAEIRESQPHIWRWRDWIIESLNADKPYDEMVREMLAGDELAPGNPDTLRATGFLVRNFHNSNRNLWLESAIEHTAKAFLGITMNCAKCHDHMYDPISQEEYYRFRAIFEPHRVRADQIPGTLNVKKDGIVHSFDEKLDSKTFLFLRGNEKHPVKGNPLTPIVPANLSPVDLVIVPVTLAPREYYPGLKDHVQNDNLNYARAALQKSQQALIAVTGKLNPTPKEPASEPDAEPGESEQTTKKITEKTYPEADVDIVAKKVAFDLLQLQSVRARIASDTARYAVPQPSDATELALAAAHAEREALLAKSDWSLATAQLALTKAVEKQKPKNEKSKKAVTTAIEAVKSATVNLDSARTDLKKTDDQYSSFGKIYPKQSTGRRLALARWITDRRNPLAARVAVNHIWMRHFSNPLVTTVFDFGLNGRRPTHPALLDWLAVELIDSGWRMKQIHRLILTSQTYRMASSTTDAAENFKNDPDNIYLWRTNSRRMEAEIVRDSMLHVAGQLDLTTGGPDIDQSQGQTVFRRSIYFRTAKEKQMPFLVLFDQASVNECYRRNESIVPQQALAMVNSPLAISQGRQLAQRLTKQTGGETTPAATTAFVTAAFEQILTRLPTDEERQTCNQFLKEQTARLADPSKLTKFNSGPDIKIKPATEPALRARENLVQVLFSHNDFFTIR